MLPQRCPGQKETEGGITMNDRKILTDRTIRAAKPAKPGERNQIADGIVPGLALRVTDKHTKSFVLVARYPGSNNPTRRALGTYGAITLDDARAKARDWLALLQQGIDPAEQEARERAEQQRKRLNTFAAMAEDFIASKLPSEKRGKEIELTVRRELLPKWGGLAVTDITESHVRDLVKAKARDYEAMARNLLALIRRIFNWAIDQRAYGLEHSPCARLKPNKLVGEQEARTRILCNLELRALWRAAETIGGPYGKFYQMLLLTGQRRNEVAGARWSEIDLREKLWTIPAERMKAGAAHEVPLSNDAVAILKSLPRGKGGDFVFSQSDGMRPIARFSAEKERLDKAMAKQLGSKLDAFVVHDIRRTMRTGLSAIPNVTDLVRELVIGHTKPELHKVYDQHAYQTEKRYALDQWAKRLRGIVAGDAANVVPIRA
jgi:integrase